MCGQMEAVRRAPSPVRPMRAAESGDPGPPARSAGPDPRDASPTPTSPGAGSPAPAVSARARRRERSDLQPPVPATRTAPARRPQRRSPTGSPCPPGPLHAGAPVGGGGHASHVGHGGDYAHLRRRRGIGCDDGHGAAPAQEAGDLLARGDGSGQADALSGTLQEVIEPLQTQRQVGAALAGGEGVDLVDDDGLDAAQGLAHSGREHEVEGFGRRDEDVGRAGAQTAALGGGRVPAAHADGDRRGAGAEAGGGDGGQRPAQVALDVGAQGLERGDVQHAHAAPSRPCGSGRVMSGRGVLDEPVDGGQESGQRLARSGGRDDQRVLAATDDRPGALLDRRRAAREGGAEPGPGRGGEGVQGPRSCGRFKGHASSMAGAVDTNRGRDSSGRSGVTVGRQCDTFTILTITAGTTGTGPRQYECANEGDPSGRESGNRLRPGPSPTDPAETGRARDREVEARSRWNA